MGSSSSRSVESMRAGAPVPSAAILLDENGQDVPFRTDAGGLVFPEQPLKAGERYTWQYREWCSIDQHPEEIGRVGLRLARPLMRRVFLRDLRVLRGLVRMGAS